MRWVTFSTGGQGPTAGLIQGEQILAGPPGSTILALLGDDGELLQRTGELLRARPDSVHPLDAVTLHAPIPSPPTVRDFYAFEQHVKTARRKRGLDMDPDWYEMPVFYFSNPHCVGGPFDDVAMAPGTEEMDFELEVAAVVGRSGSDLSPNQASSHIAGFCVMNDWSARDIQRREMKLSMGPVKGKDFATTLGPMLVTPDELAPKRKDKTFDLQMTARVNGKEYSRAALSDIYWSFEEMLSYASRGTKIVPGEVIGSGTCGTGCILELALVHGGEQFPWLQPDDVVELEVEMLGTLRNRVVAGAALIPLR